MNASHKQDELAVSTLDLTKVYRRGREQVRALDNVYFQVRRGEFVAVVGPSGSGKTTLLNLLGCMDAPTSGKMELLGIPAEKLSERERTQFRRECIGFVFQHFGLMAALTVAENVALPAFLAGRRVHRRSEELLDRVGISHRRDHRPHELSGGEMQRAAIARALINGPQLLMADEPTGNLDGETGEAVIRLFRELNRDGLTIVVVTHNRALADAADRRLEIRDGKIRAADAGNQWDCAEAASPLILPVEHPASI
jgi:putative ABC transport system ATP-binding protein